MARIVVSGYMVRHPVAGNIATFFQYVLGLHRLGHEVLYLEEKGWPYSCWDPVAGELNDFPRQGLPVIRALVAEHCPDVPVVFVDADRGRVDGMTWPELKEALRTCDLLLDVSGMLWFAESRIAPRRALIDCDPLFTQTGQFGGEFLGDYQVHFSYGGNIGSPDCAVPTLGIDWARAVPPVVPDLWTSPRPSGNEPFTTVAAWSSYDGVTVDGVFFGQKDLELRRIRDLPGRVSLPLGMALSNADEPTRAAWKAAGWRLEEGAVVTRTLDDYRHYMAASRGEFSVAKHGYVRARTGWFSERTVCYLAAGRPAVVQDTGFSSWLDVGRGVVAFDTVDEAAHALESVGADLDTHSAAALALVASTFDYRVALPALLDRALSVPTG